MAAGARTCRLALLLLAHATPLLPLLPPAAARAAPGDPAEVPISCHANISNEEFFLRFSVPKSGDITPNSMTAYYSVKGEKPSTKVFLVRNTEEISGWIQFNLQPKALYEVRVTPSWPVRVTDNFTQICEFCSYTDQLDPVRNLTTHSVGANWFALMWSASPTICPKDVKYSITYNDRRTPLQEWIEKPGYPLTLSTGEQYVIVTENVYPNTTYFVTVARTSDKLRSTSEKLKITTLPDPAPPRLEEPPKVLNSTNSTLEVSVSSANCPHHCTATWQYRTLNGTVWNIAGKAPANETFEVSGLNASTVYQVRALLQRSTECQPYESEDLPLVETTTRPVLEPIVPDYSPEVSSATNTSLTVITECGEECTKGYIAHWEYKNSLDANWTYAGHKDAYAPMVISGLTPATHYSIRFNLQWPTGPRNLTAFSSVLKTQTCSNNLEAVSYVWVQSRNHSSIRVQWSRDAPECRPAFFVRWKAYAGDGDREFPPDSFDAFGCPRNATLLADASVDCSFSEYYYCFAVHDNLTDGTRYLFEVTTTDGHGRCSEPETLRTATPLKMWGGISVGQWCLIIIGVLLLLASVPGCLVLRKRLSNKIAASRDIAFSTSSSENTGSTGYEDMDRHTFQEPSTRILDRRPE